MPLRPHEVLAFLIELEDDDERQWVLRGGFELLEAAHDAGLVEWSKAYTVDDFARAVEALREENLVELDDPHAHSRSPHAPFLGNELGNSRDIRVMQAGRAQHALLGGQRPRAPMRGGAAPSLMPQREVASGDDAAVERDFFISYNRAERAWAEWIAWRLEEAGYTTVIQAWDFVPGSNFVAEMDKAAKQAERTIAVLSPNYLDAQFTRPEWASAFAGDPTGAKRKLVPVRVDEVDVRGLLGQIVYLDLVGLDEDQAHERLLAGVGERLKPSVAPAFPGAVHAGERSPVFPGEEDAPGPTPAPSAAPATSGQTLVKVHDVIVAVDELDDTGETITLKGRLDDDTHRRLDALRRRGYGTTRVRFVSANRVADADLHQLRRTTRAGATETAIELTRAEAVRGDALRAGTTGMSADDLVEVGMRHYFLGEPLPAKLGLLEHMAETGLDRDALAHAFALDDATAIDVVRLLVVEALVGKGNAQAVTHAEVGPRRGEAREIVIEWLEPHIYSNIEPQRRRIAGTWRSP
jgi:hypothetical protein